MTPDQVKDAAQRLDAAERTRRQIGLLSQEFPDAGLSDAYAVQDAWVAMKRAAGRRQIGWKIGLTSRAMQDALKIDTPDSGILFDDMDFAEGSTVPEGRFIQPRVEAEIAFVLKDRLAGAQLSIEDVLAATEALVPSLEILDTRILRQDPATGRMRTIFDTISDNAANAGLVLGTARINPRALDPRWMGAIVKRGGAVEETGLGAGVLDHPAMGIVWLARRLYGMGQALEPGQVVLSGSFIRPVEARPGDLIEADFGPMGLVRIAFA